MLLGVGYLYVCYTFLQIIENNRLKKASWPKFCNIIFLLLLKVGLVVPVSLQINFVLP